MQPHRHDSGCTCCQPDSTLSRRALLLNGLGAGAALALVPSISRLGAAGASASTHSKHAGHPSAPRTNAARKYPINAPKIVRRRQWGANEALRHGAPTFMASVEKVVVHHTGTPNSVTDWAAQVRQIYGYETSTGYQDIAYHFLIDPNGRIYEGRWARNYGPHEAPNGANTSGHLVHGGHAINHNERTVGIALLGDYTKREVPTAMFNATIDLIAWLCSRFRIDPVGASPYLAATGAVEHLDNICPHGATTLTECPGTSVLLALQTIRQDVAARLGNTPAPHDGYLIASGDGREVAFGAARPLAKRRAPGARFSGITTHPDRNGYWAYGADGGVFGFGSARYFGSMAGKWLSAPIVGLASCKGENGYWLASSDGGVFSFGGAPFLGGANKVGLRAPIVDIERTPSGKGYWLVSADGGVFGFGDAKFYGAAAKHHLRDSITAIAASARGYWLASADGGVFAFGDAHYAGAGSNLDISGRVVDISPTPSGRGYLLLTNDGGVFAFGDAKFRGSARGLVDRAVGLVGPVERR